MDMPKITVCDVVECAYNRGRKCHTPAITVGSEVPLCDTSTVSTKKGGFEDVVGEVGACRVDYCSFNENLECNAPGIEVEKRSGHAECATFKMRAVL